jgi:hypothetical protein
MQQVEGVANDGNRKKRQSHKLSNQKLGSSICFI